ncbi:hypothetical protein BPAE_0517g00020 [Botrytis paeoniae]|uniref:Uncharacterized protein n=1 Tax=Botrytis paeoniae TaxID=278948 RepID=A0A4Z1F3U4_9HELO|nr:hypothetical protein BPAE_0517g00020 [Botrytis paeoniae]
MQFVAAPTPNHTVAPSIRSSIKATGGLCRVQFEIVPRRISQIDRIPIIVHTLSREVIHLNISIESIVGDLIDKIHNITNCKLVSYGIEPVFLVFCSRGRPRSHEAQKYMPQTAAQKRLLEHYVAIQENCGGKRAAISADANTNIVQDIEADTFNAEDWDTENAFIFNLQMINGLASEIVLGMKPPPCPITMAVRKEYHCPLLSVQNDEEEENNDNSDEEEEEENCRKVFEVTTDQSGAKVNFAPVDHMTERLGSIIQLPDDDV